MNYVYWDIKSGNRPLYSLSLTSRNPIGMRYIWTILSASIIAEVTSINSTFIASTLTLVGVAALVGNIVVCNGLEITLIVHTVDGGLLTVQIFLQTHTFC